MDSYNSLTYGLGETGGERLHQLTLDEMPSHSHSTNSPFSQGGFDTSGDNKGYATGGYPRRISVGDNQPYNGHVYNFLLNSSGGDLPHNNMQPYMAVHWIIKI